MVTVAVAGGTGALGRTIVQGLVASGKYDVKILGRNSNPEVEAEVGATIIPVNYTDVAALTKILEEHDIHTVISTIDLAPPDGSTAPEIEIIQAANASKTTKRMISSNWGTPNDASHLKLFPWVGPKLKAFAELEKQNNLEGAVVYNGFFADYWALPRVHSNLVPFTSVIDIPNNAAAIPGSGEKKMSFTHTTDVAKLVAEIVSLDKWPESHEFFLAGDKLTWNQFLHLAEEVKGTKFQVAYDSIEKLRAGHVTELPGQIPVYQFVPREFFQGLVIGFGIASEEGLFDFNEDLIFRSKEIKTRTIKELLQAGWGKV